MPLTEYHLTEIPLISDNLNPKSNDDEKMASKIWDLTP